MSKLLSFVLLLYSHMCPATEALCPPCCLSPKDTVLCSPPSEKVIAFTGCIWKNFDDFFLGGGTFFFVHYYRRDLSFRFYFHTRVELLSRKSN